MFWNFQAIVFFMPFTRYDSFKAVTIWQEMAAIDCEAGASGKGRVLYIMALH